MEYNDIYDENRNLTGRLHLRGTPWKPGEYGLVVCVWVHDGRGRILLTRRAPEKSFAGTWENSGGAAQAGESSLQAIARELEEETGIRAEAGEFELLTTVRDKNTFYDHYCLMRDVPMEQVVLQPGETDGAQWATFEQVHELIRGKQICDIIAQQFLHEEPELRKRQFAQNGSANFGQNNDLLFGLFSGYNEKKRFLGCPAKTHWPDTENAFSFLSICRRKLL